MKVLYLSSLIFSVIAILIAVAMINVQSALDAWWKLASIFSGGMLGLFLLGFVSKRVNNSSAIVGISAGLLIIGWMSLSPLLFPGTPFEKYTSNFHSYLSIVFGTSAIFITGFLTGFIFKKKDTRNPFLQQ